MSESGIGVRTNVPLVTGNETVVRLLPARGPAIDLRALVWNEQKRSGRSSRTSLRVFGCVVSNPPPEFRSLVDSIGEPEPARTRERAKPVDSEPIKIIQEPPSDPELPRPKTPLPPPKPDPNQGPIMRLRIKQVRGPRSRWLEVPAVSLLDARLWIRRNIEGEWEILEMAGFKKAGSS